MARSNAWLTIADPFAALVIAGAGFDCVTIDMQHGMFDQAAAIRTLLSLASPLRLVRVPWNEPAVIGKMLDAGADGLIVPMINSADEARALADASHYPPAGARSFGPMIDGLRERAMPYMQRAASVELHAMIETRAALAAVGDIAAVEGITGLFVGPNDLALALGHGPGADREEPELLAALSHIVQAARDAGKQAGIYCASPAYARRMVALGFGLVTIATDTSLLSVGARAALAAYGGS